MVAYLALFVALGGTGAYAAGQIGASDIADDAVRSRHIQNRSIFEPDVATSVLGRAYGVFRDGPFLIDGKVCFTCDEFRRAASLKVPAGSYLIIAKTVAEWPEFKGPDWIECRLSAGADVDLARAESPLYPDRGPAGGWAVPRGEHSDTLTMTVLHRFASSGSATVDCHAVGGKQFRLQWLKIHAIRVGRFQNAGAQ